MTIQQPNSFRTGPDERGHFGLYGGRFVAETLMPLILEVEKAYAAARKDPAFQAELDGYLADYVGRPSPPGRVASRGALASNSSRAATRV